MGHIQHYINKVIEGDCLKVMHGIPDASIDMILCDLPYGTTANPWDEVIDFNLIWPQYERIIKSNGVIALTAHGIFTGKLMMSNPSLYRYKIIWIKSKAPNFLDARRQPLKKHEDICIFYKKQPVYHPQMTMAKPYDRGCRKYAPTGSYGKYASCNSKSSGERYPYDVVFFEEEQVPDWVYCKTAETEGKTVHPTQKPVALGRYLIKTFTSPGAIILDNACGSGSFLEAALLENRYYIGIEKNTGGFYKKDIPINFIRHCRERLKKVRGQLRQGLESSNTHSLNTIGHENTKSISNF